MEFEGGKKNCLPVISQVITSGMNMTADVFPIAPKILLWLSSNSNTNQIPAKSQKSIFLLFTSFIVYNVKEKSQTQNYTS